MGLFRDVRTLKTVANTNKTQQEAEKNRALYSLFVDFFLQIRWRDKSIQFIALISILKSSEYLLRKRNKNTL